MISTVKLVGESKVGIISRTVNFDALKLKNGTFREQRDAHHKYYFNKYFTNKVTR